MIDVNNIQIQPSTTNKIDIDLIELRNINGTAISPDLHFTSILGTHFTDNARFGVPHGEYCFVLVYTAIDDIVYMAPRLYYNNDSAYTQYITVNVGGSGFPQNNNPFLTPLGFDYYCFYQNFAPSQGETIPEAVLMCFENYTGTEINTILGKAISMQTFNSATGIVSP